MRKLLVVTGLLSLLSLLSAGSALADPFTLCVKDNGKMNRGALGESPAKGGCKNPNKWTEVTLATEDNVLALDDEINGPGGIADRVEANKDKSEENMARIDALEAGGISSLIGGGHGAEGPFSPPSVEIRYVRMFGTDIREVESEVTSKLAAAGHITRLAVILDENPGAGRALLYEMTINGVRQPLKEVEGDPIGGICAIGSSANMCETEGCLKVNVGDTLSVRVQFQNTGAEPGIIPPGRWTARFVETDADCPLFES